MKRALVLVLLSACTVQVDLIAPPDAQIGPSDAAFVDDGGGFLDAGPDDAGDFPPDAAQVPTFDAGPGVDAEIDSGFEIDASR